ncbi:MAG: glycosyltransferase, partial [Lachnospiraceae bacterium]|nr:glycosyltransferase [Lachnospiraceae bacterium]
IAVQEAQILGCVVLVSDCSGNREQVRDGIDGALCQLDARDISEKIKQLLHDEALCGKYGRNAAKKMDQEEEGGLELFEMSEGKSETDEKAERSFDHYSCIQ